MNIIIFALVALLVRKTVTVALSGIVVMYVGIATPLGVWGAAIGVLLILASIVAGMIFGRVVYTSRIDKNYIRLKGGGESFLSSLPPFQG